MSHWSNHDAPGFEDRPEPVADHELNPWTPADEQALTAEQSPLPSEDNPSPPVSEEVLRRWGFN